MTPALPDSDGFGFRDGQLHGEDLPLANLAKRFGTPLYVYSRRAIERAFDRYAVALRGRASLVCYAMKANSNLAILDILARRGAGFDIVSGGELARVIAAGGPALVVAPTSVGFNWLSETNRFAPTLNARLFGPGDRQAALEAHGCQGISGWDRHGYG